ncbi:UNVERIFIED_CONTAM: hypothetical protein Scaly_2113400 [Sesamum calycinum]|uniref:Uncharacterized protein n=1 Tax=Sesamum calycinum TaxID=2727403 RepID=A0AAW2MKS2_9LAMI
MWNFASSCLAGSIGPKKGVLKPARDSLDCSDDEVSSITSREEEAWNAQYAGNPLTLLKTYPTFCCGHTLCKNCILGLQWAAVKFPTLPLQLPLFVSCPWCNLLSLRLVYRGT